MTGVGTAQLNAQLTSPVLAQWALVREIESRAPAIASYAPVAVVPIQHLGIASDGSLRLVEGVRETLPTWQPAPRMEGRGPGSSKSKSSAANPSGPAASMNARPIPQPVGAMRALSPETITSCANAMFVESGGAL